MSARKQTDSFDVYAATSGELEAPLARIHDALHLIREYAPRRHERIRRDVRRFIILAAGGPQYWPGVDAITLTRRMLVSEPTEEVALVIVHEATHARLYSMGIRYLPAMRERIERACVRAEVAFAKELPDAEWWVASVQKQLDTPWWTDAEIHARRSAYWRELFKRPSA